MIAMLLVLKALDGLEKGEPERGMGGVLSTIGPSVEIILFAIDGGPDGTSIGGQGPGGLRSLVAEFSQSNFIAPTQISFPI
jgi:hypothetical protein